MEWEKKTGQLLGQYLWEGTVSLLCYPLWLLPFLRFAQAEEECPHRHGQALCDQLRFHPLARNLLLTQILSHMEKSSWQGCKSWSPWNCFSEKWPKRSKKRGNTPEAPQPGARRVWWVTSPLQWMYLCQPQTSLLWAMLREHWHPLTSYISRYWGKQLNELKFCFRSFYRIYLRQSYFNSFSAALNSVVCIG